MQVQQYKVVVCGGSGSGKTAFVNRFTMGDFESNHFPTLGVEVHPLSFYTGSDTVQFNTWDCSGTDRFNGLDDGYYVNLHGAIIFVDDGNEWKEYVSKVLSVNEEASIVLVRSKIDLNQEWDRSEVRQYAKIFTFKLCEISAKSNIDIDKPFLFLARSLLSDEELTFYEAPSTVSTEEEEPVDFDLIHAYEKEMLSHLG